MSYKMQLNEYTGELWRLEQPHPELGKLLTSKDLLIEIVHKNPSFTEKLVGKNIDQPTTT